MNPLALWLTPANIATYAVAINFAAFAAFGIDKMLAEANRRRIAERDLLMLAMIGGSPGAYAARHLFRHKTRKQPFSGQLHAVVALQGAAMVGLVAWRMFG
jgi:uncharacterized membrane protein YsdA (DUF1294 family)